MNNYQMVGFHKLDNFDIRMSLTVIAAFGVITLVSYFNELARAGLLTRRNVPAPMHYHNHHSRIASALFQTNKQLHKLNLDVKKIKDNHKSDSKSKSSDKIKFELRLNKDQSYEKQNQSEIKIYTHKNTLENFYTSVVNSSLKSITSNSSYLEKLKVIKAIEKKRLKYTNSSVVLLYQHEPGGHFFKDCYRLFANSSGYSVSPSISSSRRKEWEAMTQRQKDSYKYFYGGVSFGICEQIGHKCLYSIIASHPIDRLLQTYILCKQHWKDPNYSFCHFAKLNLHRISLYEFINIQGNRLFQRFLYYNKHCRLLGEDELCLQDMKTSFVLSNREYKIHLQNVLQNIESWFAVIGLVDYMNDSMNIFESVLGMKLTQKCSTDWQNHTLPLSYTKLRKKLINDKRIRTWLHADLAIYEKLQEVFYKQLLVQQAISNISSNLQHKRNESVKKGYEKTKAHLNVEQNKKIERVYNISNLIKTKPETLKFVHSKKNRKYSQKKTLGVLKQKTRASNVRSNILSKVRKHPKTSRIPVSSKKLYRIYKKNLHIQQQVHH